MTFVRVAFSITGSCMHEHARKSAKKVGYARARLGLCVNAYVRM